MPWSTPNRMNESVSARLSNPQLSLADALPNYPSPTPSGFSFGNQQLPTSGSFGYGKQDKHVMDDDEVSLQQRKNQLLRRLRKVCDQKKRKRKSEGKTTMASGTCTSTGDEVGDRSPKAAKARQRRQRGISMPYPRHIADETNDTPGDTDTDTNTSAAVILERLTALGQAQSVLRMNAFGRSCRCQPQRKPRTCIFSRNKDSWEEEVKMETSRLVYEHTNTPIDTKCGRYRFYKQCH